MRKENILFGLNGFESLIGSKDYIIKKILIHSLTFPPDTISTGMIVSEIADGLNKELNNIEVLASSPQYNLKSVQEYNKNEKNIIREILDKDRSKSLILLK